MKEIFLQASRVPGVFFAAGPDGKKLPVIDVTHPAFAVVLSESQLKERVEIHLQEEARLEKQPRWLQRVFFNFFLRKSVLANNLQAAEGGSLDGMSTYRLKLGADILDSSSTHPFDLKIARSLPCLSLRLRLQDMAELLAGSLSPRLASQPRKTLHLVNIAGGPSMDSINALIVLQKRNPYLLQGRSVRIDVLDQDASGPAFAARALTALQAHNAPLEGVDVTLNHLDYHWGNPSGLRDYLIQLPDDLITAISSEGGLFDYGSDEEITANLTVLRDNLPRDIVFVGSVTRAQAPGGRAGTLLRFATRPRELASFEQLINRSNWALGQRRARPFSFDVQLTPLRSADSMSAF